MSVAYVVDGETYADSTYMNTLVDAINNGKSGVGNLLDYDGVADSTTDNSPMFAEALSENQVVLVPSSGAFGSYYKITEPIVPADNQAIIAVSGFQYPGSGSMTRITGSFAGPLIDGSGVAAVTVRGITFNGSPTEAASKGILWDEDNWLIEECTFNQFGGRALHMTAGAAGRINKNLALNCLMVRTGHSDYIGVFDLDGSDLMVTQNEVTASMESGDYETGYIAALRHTGGNGFFSQNVWELSEVGVYADAYLASFVNDRADVNLGHGWVIDGTQQRFLGCRGYRNSLETNNTYDHFRVLGTKNLLVACEADDEGDANRAKYALNDTSNASGADLNRYALNEWRSYVTAATNFAGSSAGYLDLFSKPAVTGSKGANAALTSLLTQLAAIGLITDSTS
jgi:hypothetical protein